MGRDVIPLKSEPPVHLNVHHALSVAASGGPMGPNTDPVPIPYVAPSAAAVRKTLSTLDSHCPNAPLCLVDMHRHLDVPTHRTDATSNLFARTTSNVVMSIPPILRHAYPNAVERGGERCASHPADTTGTPPAVGDLRWGLVKLMHIYPKRFLSRTGIIVRHRLIEAAQ